MKPIDIIVPIYNAYEFTEECIKSVMKNTDLTVHTLVLINDKSPDEKILQMLLKYKNENTNKKIVANKRGLSISEIKRFNFIVTHLYSYSFYHIFLGSTSIYFKNRC